MSKPSNEIGVGGRILAILAYHKIGEPSPGGWNTWFYVPEAIFTDHLRYLHEHGWKVIDLSALLEALAKPHTLPERAAVITFDDGYRSNLEVALPWLLRFGYPAVLFVATDFIGGCNTFDVNIEPEEAICDWDDLRKLERHGVAVQSHGASHRPMSELSPIEQETELRRSKTVLETGLGRPVTFFSFPYGDSGKNPEEVGHVMRRIGYQAACLYRGGPQRLPVANPYCLARLAMGPDANLDKVLLQSEFQQ